MLISPAYAQAAGGASPGGGLEMFLPFVLILVIFYFLLWRPQQKKMKTHREMLGSLKRGDRVLTGGGIFGRIARVEGDDELIVEIAPEVRVRVARGTVSEVMAKGEPAKASSKGEGSKKSSSKDESKGAKADAKSDAKSDAKADSKGSAPTVERK